jgi:tripartite motif-containing protein 56
MTSLWFNPYIFKLTALYTMSYPFTFTNMGATGQNGPTSISYGTSTPGYGTSNVMTLSGGIQYWTVPTTGFYRLIAAGATAYVSNSTTPGGLGVIVSNVVALTKGQLILILVGQIGSNNGSGTGGGGGTFIATTYNTLYNAVPILVAGGGGGAWNGTGTNGQLTTAGAAGASGGVAGTNGNGGSTNDNRTDDPGAGFYTGPGNSNSNAPTCPQAFIMGGQGGNGGGFGGGGFPGGGGGGGYSGGGGTQGGSGGSCGGGGSFDMNNNNGGYAAILYTGVSGFSTGYNNGQGFAIVNYLGPS